MFAIFRLISGLFGFYRQASAQARLDPSTPDGSGGRHVSYHRRIVFTAAGFGLLGLGAGLAGVAFLFLAPDDPRDAPARRAARPGQEAKEAFMPFVVPPILGAVGLVFGMSLACAFLPRAFYEGPVGKSWLALIGTDSPGLARGVCLTVTALIGGVVALIAWVLVNGPRR